MYGAGGIISGPILVMLYFLCFTLEFYGSLEPPPHLLFFQFMTHSLSGIVLRHTGVDSEHVTGGFRARKNCERVSNICLLKSVILVISVGNY